MLGLNQLVEQIVCLWANVWTYVFVYQGNCVHEEDFDYTNIG